MLAALFSPVGRFVGGAVAILAVCALVYGAGWRAHAAISREQQYKAERDSALRDLENARKAAKAAEDMADEMDAAAQKARKKADDYAKSLPHSGGCILGDDDVKQLRNIRGKKG